MYNNEDLEKMSKEQLILLVTQLQNQVNKQAKPSKAGVINIGSPKFVQEYVRQQKIRLKTDNWGDK